MICICVCFFSLYIFPVKLVTLQHMSSHPVMESGGSGAVRNCKVTVTEYTRIKTNKQTNKNCKRKVSFFAEYCLSDLPNQLIWNIFPLNIPNSLLYCSNICVSCYCLRTPQTLTAAIAAKCCPPGKKPQNFAGLWVIQSTVKTTKATLSFS